MDATQGSVFGPVAVASTYEETIDRLGTAIRIGLLGPGSRLPPERDLAEMLSISRSTLRQALAALIETGHLVALRGRSGGTFVADKPPMASSQPFALHEARSLLDWRLTLELAAAELAAERADLLACEALAEAADRFQRPDLVNDWAQFRRADAAFHLRLAVASGADRMVSAMTEVHGELNDLWAVLSPPVSLREATAEEHVAVLAAVQRRDPDGARAAMREHCANTALIVDQLSTTAV